MVEAGVEEYSINADGEAWRQQQNDQRVLEVHAALDHLNAQLQAADADRFGDFHACTQRDVSLVGHSFGGATVAACVLRDSPGGGAVVHAEAPHSVGEPRATGSGPGGGARAAVACGARFSHCFLFDPWIGGFACPLAEAELRHRRLTDQLRTLRVWFNDGAVMRRSSSESAEALVAKARAAGAHTADVVRVPSNSHYAQTDVPTVFETGPLSCVYGLLKGKHDPDGTSLSAKEALRSSIMEVLEPLLEERWLAIGLAPLGG